MTDIDLSSLWSWILPLWSLFLVVAFLGGVLIAPVVLQGVTKPTSMTASTK